MELVLEFLKEKVNLKREDSVVIGVSAGPDSMCLLYLLQKLQKSIGFKIIVAHINHKKKDTRRYPNINCVLSFSAFSF